MARSVKQLRGEVAAEEFTYGDDHQNQKLWIFKPKGLKNDEVRPCVFFVHGGGWGGEAYYFAAQCVYLSRLDIVCVTIHFRGARPTPKNSLADSLSAYRWVKKNGKQHHIDTDKIVVSGGSAGGHLSLAMVPGVLGSACLLLLLTGRKPYQACAQEAETWHAA